MRFLQCLGALGVVHHALCSSNDQIPLTEPNTKYEPFSESFDQYVEENLKDFFVPGVAIAVIRGNETWTKGYGYADLENSEPVTPYTLFQGASTTKVHTASILALMVENSHKYGGITFDTKIQDVLADFKLADAYETTQTTFQDALSHRTGLPSHDFAGIFQNVSIEQQVHSLRYLPRSAPLRSKWQYSNTMYEVVAHSAQTLANEEIGNLYTSWLWRPLNMTHSYFNMDDAQSCRRENFLCKVSKQYVWSGSKQRFLERDSAELPGADGATGWITTIADNAKWVRSLAQASGPLSPASHKALRSPLSIVTGDEPRPTWYGMGLRGTIYRDHLHYSHTGSIGSYISLSVFMPELNWGFAVMQNSPSRLISVLGDRLTDDFLGIPMSERSDPVKKWHKNWEEKKRSIAAQPNELFPTVLEPPRLPALQISDYAGQYREAGYGNMTLLAGLPSHGLFKDRPWRDGHSGMTLHMKATIIEAAMIFYHVSGENWLVEEYLHENMDDDVPSGYTKAKSVIGADGKVEAFHVLIEDTVPGDAAWTKFARVSK